VECSNHVEGGIENNLTPVTEVRVPVTRTGLMAPDLEIATGRGSENKLLARRRGQKISGTKKVLKLSGRKKDFRSQRRREH